MCAWSLKFLQLHFLAHRRAMLAWQVAHELLSRYLRAPKHGCEPEGLYLVHSDMTFKRTPQPAPPLFSQCCDLLPCLQCCACTSS